MDIQEPDDNLEDLISIIDTIATDKLKRQGYQKYVDTIADVARRSLEVDGTRLTIVIQYIKNYKDPCFQRDMLIDVLHKLVAPHELTKILMKPFCVEKRNNWDQLATGITAIPDLIGNCDCLSKHPELRQETFYELLSRTTYDAIESQPRSLVYEEYKLFILKIVGRIAMLGQGRQIIWKHLTSRAIREPRDEVKKYYFDLIRITLSPREQHMPFGIFMESLYLPIFLNLKPSNKSGSIIKYILGNSVMTSEQLRYLICDKSLFKTHYTLPKEKQAILLFNIAAYLSSLVTTSPPQSPLIDKDKCDNGIDGSSLLVTTLLEVVRSWTSSTKILIRTYQHSKYITYALVVLLRHAIQYDKRSLVDHAAGIQTMIARSIPTYLNRTSQELRNLATCMSGLVMPKLHDLVISNRGGRIAKDGENKEEELKLNFNVDLDDDLLYLQQLFQQDVEVLFRDLADIATTAPTSPCPSPSQQQHKQPINRTETKPARLATADATTTTTTTTNLNNRMTNSARRANDRQLPGKETKVEADGVTTTTRRDLSNRIVVELDDQNCENEAKVDNDDDKEEEDEEDDLMPYKIDDSGEQDNCDDDEFALGEDAANVPIYLRDCINGLVENNSRLYVRLCLIKAGVLVDDLIEQDARAYDDLMSKSQLISSSSSFASRQTRQISQADSMGRRGQPGGDPMCGLAQKTLGVNDTIRDVGVELARALLFLEDQFKTENFNAHRMNCLISLCYAAPDLVGRYLIEEYNGPSRSMQQQLDILHILVASAHQLSTGARIKHGPELVRAEFKEAVCVRPQVAKTVNKFAPHAAMYFYGIVYRLKADLADAGSLVISQPKSIMSAFRQQSNKDQSTVQGGGTKADRADIMIKRAIAQESNKEKQRSKAPATSRVLDTEEADENFLETNCLSDDSFLLSRILISIANIISCSSQQVVTCKLSTDLLDILSAYRCHPDSGVQEAMVNCLRMIRDCTPSTYYREYIEKRMMHLFGPWLSENKGNM